jgi:hypothetical protein
MKYWSTTMFDIDNTTLEAATTSMGQWIPCKTGAMKLQNFGDQVGGIKVDWVVEKDHPIGAHRTLDVSITIQDDLRGALLWFRGESNPKLAFASTGRRGLSFLRWVLKEIELLQKGVMPPNIGKVWGLMAVPADFKRERAYRFLLRKGFKKNCVVDQDESKGVYDFYWKYPRKQRKKMR